MDCTQTRNYLHGYLDRELDPVTASGIEEHLNACAACARAYTAQTSLRAAIRQQAAYYTAPNAFAARLRDKINATSGSAAKKSSPRWQWFPLVAAVAATAVITWTTAIQLETGSRSQTKPGTRRVRCRGCQRAFVIFFFFCRRFTLPLSA